MRMPLSSKIIDIPPPTLHPIFILTMYVLYIVVHVICDVSFGQRVASCFFSSNDIGLRPSLLLLFEDPETLFFYHLLLIHPCFPFRDSVA